MFQNDSHRHLGIQKFGNFNDWNGKEGQTASPCQILSKSIKPSRSYGIFQFFKMTASAILDFQILEVLTVRTLKRPEMRHLAKWRFFDFSNIAAAAILDFRNFKDGRTASPCPNSAKSVKLSPRYGDFFDFSRWQLPPSWIFKISNF